MNANEFFPLENSKKEIQIFAKIINNFIIKASIKYNIKNVNVNFITLQMKELLSALYIISDLTYINNYDAKKEIEKSFYEKNIGWSLNNAYNNIFKLINNSDCDLKCYLINDMENITHAYSKIKFWNSTREIPEKEEYANTIKNKFPKTFFAKTLQNHSDKIDLMEYEKIAFFLEKFIICRNYRDDYKYFFESYLKNYNEYTSNFIFVFLEELKFDKIDEIKNLFTNIKKNDNKIKILEILHDNNIPNKIYDELKILQDEIMVEAKKIFNVKYNFRAIEEFNVENAKKYYGL